MRKHEKPWFAMATVGFVTLFGRIASLIFVIIVADLISIQEYGSFRAILAIGTFAAFFTSSGASVYVARNVSHKLDDRFAVSEIISTGILLQTIFLFISIVFLAILQQLSIEVLIVLIGAIIFDYTASVLRGLNRYGMFSFFQILTGLFKLVFLIIIGYIMVSDLGTFETILVYSLSVIPSLAVIIFFGRNSIKHLFAASFSINQLKYAISFSIPAIIITVTHNSIINLAVPFTFNLHGGTSASFLSVAITFGSILTFISSAVTFVIMPTVARISDPKIVKRNLKFYALVTALISAVALIGLLVFPDIAIEILFSEEYLPAASYFPMIIPGFFFIAISSIFDAVWIGVGNLRIPLITNSIGAGLNICWLIIIWFQSLNIMQIAYSFFFSWLLCFALMIVFTIRNSASLSSKIAE